MKKYLSSVLIMLCILLSAVVASAEKAEWKADNYDLSKVQKIYVEDDVEKDESVSFSDLEALKVRQSLDENEKYIKKYTKKSPGQRKNGEERRKIKKMANYF